MAKKFDSKVIIPGQRYSEQRIIGAVSFLVIMYVCSFFLFLMYAVDIMQFYVSFEFDFLCENLEMVLLYEMIIFN